MESTNQRNPEKSIPLLRVLGVPTAILLVAGMMIGSGVFKKIIPMAQSGLTETWILGAWVIAGIITMFGAFTISGLATLTEESGGVYEYLRLAFGNFFSFLFGWTDFTIIGSASIAALGFIFAQTVNVFIPLPSPFASLADISIGSIIFPFADSGVKIIAIASVVLLTWINYRGVKKGGYMNNVITAAKIIGILMIIVLGLLYTSPEVAPEPVATAETIEFGTGAFFTALFAAMLSAFWAYDGWSSASFITGEIKNPKRNLPIAIIAGVTIAMTLYVLINYAYMHVLSLQQLRVVEQNQIGAVVVAETMIGSLGQTLITALIMISVFGALNGIILAHSRIYYRMAQENFFFKKAANVHPRYRTPYISLLYTMIWSCVLIVSGTFDMLTDMVIFAGFLFYGFIAIALIKMKRSGSIKSKVIGYPWAPLIIIVFSIALIYATVVAQPGQSLIGLGLILIGIPFYFYFRKNDKTTNK
ncbi:MAG: amino acid permease [Chitinophagaceae bacterium]|nr:amino acid permease [Chitinophagaceae bacterium]